MTPNDAIHRALRLLGVVAVEETPSASEINQALASFNDMLAQWRLGGIDMGVDSLNLNEDIPVPADHNRAFPFNLAMELANEYGIEPQQASVQIANASLEMLRRAYTKPHRLRVDNELQQTYRRFGYQR